MKVYQVEYRAVITLRAAFATNSKLLAEIYFNHRCPDYGRIEKLVNGKYRTVAEKAYGIRHADN